MGRPRRTAVAGMAVYRAGPIPPRGPDEEGDAGHNRCDDRERRDDIVAFDWDDLSIGARTCCYYQTKDCDNL